MASNTVTKMTAEEYLALDRAAEFKSEFLDGEIVAMSGGSVRHSELQANLIGEFREALKKTQCKTFTSDFRVRVSAQTYAYPDVTIVCGKPQLVDQRQDILLNPTVIFEVLSPSTGYYDRGLKFRRYREIASLTDYILVDPDQIRIEQFTRGADNTWVLHDHQCLEDVLRIVSLGVSVPLSAIYDRVEFPAE
jgi:Uma2 family endonuclease